MVRIAFKLLLALLLGFALAPLPINAQQQAQLTVLNRGGSSISRLTDGDTLRLRLTLAANTPTVTRVAFLLEGSAAVVGECTMNAGDNACETGDIAAYGWYWGDSGSPAPTRQLSARGADGMEIASLPLTIAPRPVVYVHGFGSSWQTWRAHLGDDGFLAQYGLHGYAVGDGQAQGVMDTGSLTAPTERTNTIAENAAIVGQYIADVKAQTGATQVDLVAHSMGGLISRYYVARVMQERDVAQLIMLGSPQQGTACANLPASLDFHLPATLEIRPDYVREIFNRQITERHDVPFSILAGTSILSAIQSPCEAVPSDIVISRHSAGGIPAQVTEMAVLHTDMNLSEQVFTDFLLPLLRTPPGGRFTDTGATETTEPPDAPIQFTHVLTGQVPAGGSADVTIQIDDVAIANFALYDPTQSLTVTVRGASGNVVELDPARHGLVVVDNPETLVHLGYGFNEPNPGPWQLTLTATDATPPEGAPYAVTALVQGGATLTASTSHLLPVVGTPLTLTAQLEGAGGALTDAMARIVHPDGVSESLPLAAAGTRFSAQWTPPAEGLYSIEISAQGALPDGSLLERSHFMAVEAQSGTGNPEAALWAGAGIAGLVVLALGALTWRAVRRRSAARRVA